MKMSFFTWEVVWRRILMLDQPRKRDGYHQTDVISVRVMNNWLIVISFIALKPEAQNFVAVGLFFV